MAEHFAVVGLVGHPLLCHRSVAWPDFSMQLQTIVRQALNDSTRRLIAEICAVVVGFVADDDAKIARIYGQVDQAHDCAGMLDDDDEGRVLWARDSSLDASDLISIALEEERNQIKIFNYYR